MGFFISVICNNVKCNITFLCNNYTLHITLSYITLYTLHNIIDIIDLYKTKQRIITMSATTINVSKDAQDAILQAIETVYARTQRKPKYSEIQEIYQTSNSYIKPVLAAWLDSNSEQLQQSKADEKPASVELDANSIKAITDVLSVEVAKAQAVADAKLDDERKAMYEIRDEALAELDAQMNIADDRFATIEQLNEKLEAEKQQVSVYKAQSEKWKEQFVDAESKIKHLSDDISRLESRNSTLDAELTDNRSKLATSQSEAIRANMLLEEMTARNQRLVTEYEQTQASHSKALTQKDEQINTVTAQLNAVSNDALADKQALATARGEKEYLAQQVTDLTEQLKKATAKLKSN